ncbi:MAG: YdcF family protein [Mariprofundaceae bacterium]|nr:YdcF family protein [Mariprofundaceae bacterium]
MMQSLSILMIPPGLFIVVGLLGCLFYRRKLGRLLIIGSFSCLWLMSTLPVQNFLTHSLESQFSPLPASSLKAQRFTGRHDTAIVVLGGGIYAKAPEFEGQHALQGDALMRTIYAADLAKKTGLSVYTTGGKVGQMHEAEGVVMQRVLIKMGVHPKKVFAEILSKNTWENARNIKAAFKHERIKHIILVTSATHMARAIDSFRRHGLDTTAAPCAYRTKHDSYQFRDFLPNASILQASTQALHEYFGLIWYQIHYDKPILEDD